MLRRLLIFLNQRAALMIFHINQTLLYIGLYLGIVRVIMLITSIINTMVVLMDKETLEPGKGGLAQLRLMKPVPALPKDTFVICPLNIQTVIGGGTILEISNEKYRQAHSSKVIPYLKALEEDNLQDFVALMLKRNLNRPVSVYELAHNSGFSFAASLPPK